MAGQRKAAKDATHALVLAAARSHFTARGYEAVTLRDIAMACGRSTGSIFANFKGKDAVFEAAMGRPAPDVRGFLRSLAADAVDVTTAELAAQLVRDLYGPDA